MKKTLLIGLLVFSLVALLVVGGTMAWFTDVKEAVNTFTAGTVTIEVNEYGFEDIINWNPGDTTDKDVSVISTGSKDTYVRVRLTPVWGEIVEGGFASNNLSVDNVTLNIADNGKWLESDGWYYYCEIMEKDNETELLLDSVTLAGFGTSNDYQG
ncbi:MAG: BsaA family SipW-dependent biofilm matrix protein, partial [Tepidanaerobacteraceae bacterium]|nr:BsaA family SipW-dependent biofilm matrix protein [Tepidanaerobacteraceae bacterium]